MKRLNFLFSSLRLASLLLAAQIYELYLTGWRSARFFAVCDKTLYNCSTIFTDPMGRRAIYGIPLRPCGDRRSSKELCESLGSQIVTINSGAENDFLHDWLQESNLYKHPTCYDNFWIGLRRYRRLSVRWSDGAPVAYNNIGNHPHKANYNCYVLHFDGTWAPIPCNSARRVICKISL